MKREALRQPITEDTSRKLGGVILSKTALAAVSGHPRAPRPYQSKTKGGDEKSVGSLPKLFWLQSRAFLSYPGAPWEEHPKGSGSPGGPKEEEEN